MTCEPLQPPCKIKRFLDFSRPEISGRVRGQTPIEEVGTRSLTGGGEVKLPLTTDTGGSSLRFPVSKRDYGSSEPSFSRTSQLSVSDPFRPISPRRSSHPSYAPRGPRPGTSRRLTDTLKPVHGREETRSQREFYPPKKIQIIREGKGVEGNREDVFDEG